MKPKKSKKANLENKRWLFFQIGLLFSLGIALAAFEWTSNAKNNAIVIKSPDDIFEEETQRNTYRKEEVPPPVKPEVFEFKILDNNEDFISQVIDVNPEIDPLEGFNFSNYMPEKEEDDNIPFIKVEQKPKFMNGDVLSFIKYILKNIEYSQDAIGMELQGKVIANFVVNKEGYVENVEIIRGIDPLLDNEVIKALKASPRWEPGKQRNRPVKVSYTIPIVFKLN